MSYNTTYQPRQRSLWDTLSGHASNLFERGKKLANRATQRVQSATSGTTSRMGSLTPRMAMGTPTPSMPIYSPDGYRGGKKHGITKRRKTKSHRKKN